MASRRPRLQVKPNLGARSRPGGASAAPSIPAPSKNEKEDSEKSKPTETEQNTANFSASKNNTVEAATPKEKSNQDVELDQIELKKEVKLDDGSGGKTDEKKEEAATSEVKKVEAKTPASAPARRRMIKPKVQIGGRRPVVAPNDAKPKPKIAEPSEEAAMVVIQDKVSESQDIITLRSPRPVPLKNIEEDEKNNEDVDQGNESQEEKDHDLSKMTPRRSRFPKVTPNLSSMRKR